MTHLYGDIQNWTERFPELAQAFAQVRDRKELNTVRHQIIKAMDDGSLPYPACDGAVADLYHVRKEQLTPDTGKSRSAQDARIDRILHITDSTGKRTARKFR